MDLTDDTFRWTSDPFRLAMAPWHHDPKQQRCIQAIATVTEQRSPEFAMCFELELLQQPPEKSRQGRDCKRLTRCVTQRQMLRAFEFAFVGSEAGRSRPPSGETADDKQELLDLRMQKWLAGGGRVDTPPKEDLARWILARMILASPEDTFKDEQIAAWTVCLCGEEGAGYNLVVDESEDADLDTEENGVDDGSDGEMEDEALPPYEGEIDETDNEDLPPYEDEIDETDDEDFPPLYDNVEYFGDFSSPPKTNDEEEVEVIPKVAVQRTRSANSIHPPPTVRSNSSRRSLDANKIGLQNKLSTGRLTSRRSSSRSVGSVSSSTSERREKQTLRATVVHMNPRIPSVDVLRPAEPSNEWTEDKRNFHKELLASRRDLQAAKQQHEQVQQMAKLRQSRLMKETARKLRLNDQKRRDAREIRQLIADTLEYREELQATQFRVKQAFISARHEQQRFKRAARAVVGNTEKTQYGFVKLGPGPLSAQEMQLINSDTSKRNLVYDLDGRRRGVQEASQVANDTTLESALRKIRRLLQAGNSVDIFRRYDVDRSGTLNNNEFQRILRDLGTGDAVELSREQIAALFKRFDADDSGEIDFVELLWGFFNQETFLKRWRNRKSSDTASRNVRTLFQRFDRTDQGVLSLKEFQLVFDHLKVTLGDFDAKLLAAKFDDKNGNINYLAFLDFVEDSRVPQKVSRSVESSPRSQFAPISCQETTMNPLGMERILKELQTLTTTQEKFRQLLRK